MECYDTSRVVKRALQHSNVVKEIVKLLEALSPTSGACGGGPAPSCLRSAVKHQISAFGSCGMCLKWASCFPCHQSGHKRLRESSSTCCVSCTRHLNLAYDPLPSNPGLIG